MMTDSEIKKLKLKAGARAHASIHTTENGRPVFEDWEPVAGTQG